MAKPGQTGQKVHVFPNSTIGELRRMVKEKSGVEPERQVLVYNGQILMDEQLDTTVENTLDSLVDFTGS